MSVKGKSKYTKSFKKGDVFGSWTVQDGTVSGQPAKVEVKCECGTLKKVNVYSLVKGQSTNCGCKRIGNWKGRGELSGSILYKTITVINTVNTGLTSASITYQPLTYDDLSNVFVQQTGTCALTGKILNSSNTAIARYDNSKPFSQTNIAWVASEVSPLTTAYGINGSINVVQSIAHHNPNIFEQMGFTSPRKIK